jgi:Na+-transporting methylmalonyl-CoA/oxaloacetate decarboxylase gamma subunit
MLTADRSATFTATVVIAGISIVVGVLLLLILVFKLFGTLMPKIEARVTAREEKKAIKKAEKQAKKSAKQAEKNGEPAVEQPKTDVAKAPVQANPTPAPVVEAGISNEVVAAIAGAITAIEGQGVVVRSIKRKNVAGRNPWANAANVDNTRPF